MGNRVEKLEPFKSVYIVERSAYLLNRHEMIIHLRMLSPDNGKTNVEYFSYIIERGIHVLVTKIENEVLRNMEYKMHQKLGNTLGLLKHKTDRLRNQVQAIQDINKSISKW